jgi:hypothetical protein
MDWVLGLLFTALRRRKTPKHLKKRTRKRNKKKREREGNNKNPLRMMNLFLQ